MSRRHNPGRRLAVALFCLVLANLIFIRFAAAQSGEVAVIVNPRNSVSGVSSADLRRIFAGEKRYWPDGTRIKLIVRPPGTHERAVLLRLVGMSENEYKQYWTAQVFRGEADAEPLSLPSFGMVKEAATAFPGAVGLAEARDLKNGMFIKVIKVDGRMPGEPGYPLH